MQLSEYTWAIYIIEGVTLTLKYSITSVIIGFIFGLILALGRLSNRVYLKYPAALYVSIIRGTPLLLQLSIVYFAIPTILGLKIPAFTAGIIAFSMNSSAYISEIIRSGIASIDKGQFEAAKVLHIPYSLMMKDIILPQALKNVLPGLVNEASNMIKESSLIAIIGEADLMRRAQVVAAEQYTYFAPLLVAGVCYYLLVLTLNQLAKILEKKLHATN